MRGWIPEAVFCVTLLATSVIALAATEEKATSYSGTIQEYVIDANGTLTKQDVEARLDITNTNKGFGDPELTFWVKDTGESVAFLVTPEALPDTYRGLLPEGQSRLFVYSNGYTKTENSMIELPLYLGERASEAWRTVTVLGADDQPLVGYEIAVDVYAYRQSRSPSERLTPVAGIRTAEDGTFSYPLPIPAGKRQDKVYRQSGGCMRIHGGVESHPIIITDPVLGQSISTWDASEDPSFWEFRQPDLWHLPFLPEDRAALTLMFRGRVVDTDGNPVACSVMTHGRLDFFPDRIGGSGIGLGINVSGDGRFAFTLSRHWLMKKLERPEMPPGTTFGLTAQPPEGRKLELCNQEATLRSDQENTIVLQKGAQLVIELADENGNPLTNVEFDIHSTSAGSLERLDDPATPENTSAHYSLYRHSRAGEIPITVETREAVPLPGTFRLLFRDLEFQPREITTADAAEPIIMRQMGGISIFTGRVVDTRDGLPLTGACVVMSRHRYRFNSLSFPDSERLAALFHDVPAGGSIIRTFELGAGFGDPKSLLSSSIMALGRTDADGRFRLVGTPGVRATDVSVYTPAFLPAYSSLDRIGMASQELKEYEFPEVGLVPSAIAEAKVLLPDDIPEDRKRYILSPIGGERTYRTAFKVSFEPAADWMERTRFADTSGNEGSAWYDDDTVVAFSGCEEATAYVPIPADVPFAIEAPPMIWVDDQKSLCPARWIVDQPVAQGATVILDTKTFSRCKWVDIFVSHSDGTPVDNILVHLRYLSDISVRTNANGIAGAYVEDGFFDEVRIDNSDGTSVLRQSDVLLTWIDDHYELRLTLPESSI